MEVDDEVEANWADYIFSRLLESIRRNNMTKTSRTFENDVMFGLIISFLLEKYMPATDRGEQLMDLNYLPHKNTKNKPHPVRNLPRRLPKLVKGKGKKWADAEGASSESWSSREDEKKKKGG